MNDKNVRIIEKLNDKNVWERVEPKFIVRGDVFRMYEPDMTPVVMDGQHIMIAQSDMTTNEDDVFMVECSVWDYEA